MIEHHEGESAITFQRIFSGEGADAFLFIVGEPMIARHPGVVLIDFAETLFPIVEFAGADADPGHEALDGNLALCGPDVHEIDDLIAGIVGNPTSF